MANGRLDTTHIDLGTLDQNYILGLRTRAGLDVADLISGLSAEMQVLNSGLDPLQAEVMYVTTSETGGVPTEVQGYTARKRGEHTPGRPQYGERSLNYLLPIDDWEITTGYTEDKLLTIRRDEFDAQNRGLRKGWEGSHRRAWLDRLFRLEPVRVGVGTANTSPGFAGSGSGDLAYAGIFPDNTVVPDTYTHYLRDTIGNIEATTLAAVELLRRWHPTSTFTLVAGKAVVSALTALPGTVFVRAGSALVRPGQGTAEALVDAGTYVGALHGDISVRKPVIDIPDNYAALYYSAGQLAVGNPLAWRYDPLVGRDVQVKSRSMFPLHDANTVQRFGVGVGNRTAAVLMKFATSGSYTSPTI